MVNVEFRDDRILMLRFEGRVSLLEVDDAWSALADPRFSRDHDVIVDCRDVTADFSLDGLPAVIARRDHGLAHTRGVTCFIMDSHFGRAVVEVVRTLLDRETRWRSVSDEDEAMLEIRQRRMLATQT